MSEAIEIGKWVRRKGLVVWHHVDSTVAGAAFTRCGKRMEPANKAGHGLLVSDDPQRHLRCLPCFYSVEKENDTHA